MYRDENSYAIFLNGIHYVLLILSTIMLQLNQILTDFRDMWEALCVLKLFMEHVCQPAGDGEEMMAPLALTLWMVCLSTCIILL